MRIFRRLIFLGAWAGAAVTGRAAVESDIVIYGATTAGVMAAAALFTSGMCSTSTWKS